MATGAPPSPAPHAPDERAITPVQPGALAPANQWTMIDWMRQPTNLSDEEREKLAKPFPDELGDILPTTGVVFLSGNEVRARFWEIFGERAKMITRDRSYIQAQGTKDGVYYGDHILTIDGKFAASGIGDMKLVSENREMTMADSAAGAETNAWTRCGHALCPDLIRWKRKSFQRDWRTRFAVAVRRKGNPRPYWRRYDEPPFWDEEGHFVGACPCAVCAPKAAAGQRSAPVPEVKAPIRRDAPKQEQIIDVDGECFTFDAVIEAVNGRPNKGGFMGVLVAGQWYQTKSSEIIDVASSCKRSNTKARIRWTETENPDFRDIASLEPVK